MAAKSGTAGNGNALGAALFFMIAFGIGFGISGAIAGALVLAGWRLVAASTGAFAAAGIAEGILMGVGLLSSAALRGHSEVLKVGMFAAMDVLHVLGGTLLGAAVPRIATSIARSRAERSCSVRTVTRRRAAV
jgi:hypothetical protein